MLHIDEKMKLLEDLKIEQERKRRISINKRIVEEVEELNEKMNKQYENDCKEYKTLLQSCLNKKKMNPYDLDLSQSNKDINKRLVEAVWLQDTIDLLKSNLNDKHEERKEKFNHGVKMIRCKLDSDYNRKHNLERAKRLQAVNESIKNGTNVILERKMQMKEIKVSLVKRTTPESRKTNKSKLKCVHPSAKPAGVR